MQHIPTGKHRSFFKVLAATSTAQAAMMTLRPGQSTSEQPENEHPRCEQWLFVITGSARATIGKRSVTIKPNSLLLIEKGTPHRITSTGQKPLVTLNFYAPPAYTKARDLKTLARIPTLLSALKLK